MNNLVPLFEEALEFQNYNGSVLSNGKIKVYFIGRTSLADIYNDVAGEYPSENPKILDNLGMGPIYVNPAFDYEIVVYDEYDNELFSVKKYLHSNGAHSTSNVEVVPSENIGVSAWTVGEVQIYQPYLVGEVGKTYEGIEPIVVNNDVNRISANHVPLGLQEPLYFVEDSESACIIGIDSSACGKTYSGISPILVDNTANTISITGDIGKDWTEEILSAANDASAAATAWTDSQGYLTALPEDLVYTGDLNDYAKKDFVLSSIDSSTSGLLPTSSFSSVSGSFLTALPSDLVYTADITGLATTAQLSEKLDSTAFSTVSGDFLTAHQDISNLMPKSESANFYPMTGNPSGFLTAHQDLSDYQTIEGMTAYQEAGEYYSASNPSGFITGVDLTPYQTIAGMTAYQPSGDYLTTADSAQFITALPADVVYTADIQDMATTGDLADKLDTSSFSSVSGDYLVGSNVSGFVITATGDDFSNGMTVAISQDIPFAGMYFSESDTSGTKQIYIDPEKIMFYSAGEFSTAEEINAGDIATLKTLSSSKQDNLTFSYTPANEISAINSSAIAGGTGGSFPSSANEACETVTANSANWDSTYETVSTNSASWTGGGDLSSYVRNDTQWLGIGIDNYVEAFDTATQTLSYDSFAFGDNNSAASTAVSLGRENSARSNSFAQGNRNKAQQNSLAQGAQNSAFRFSFAQGSQNLASGVNNQNGSFSQGFKNSAYSGSFAQGSYNVASAGSFAQGGKGSNTNSAIDHSLAQGSRIIASGYSLAQGDGCLATDYSIAQGVGAIASGYSQAFGRGTIASSSGMAIGTYNETDSAAFVVGNGENATARSDAFIIYHDGSVSAAGKISANGVELGAGSEIPVGTMNESAFEYDASDNITAYNGSAFKTGDEFPQSATEAIETVTANSADWNGTTETVSSNSGAWGGSALPISAGPGISLSMVDGVLVISTAGV